MPDPRHQSPRDAIFRRVFSRRANARGLLRFVLPPAIRAVLDLAALRRESGNPVDEWLGSTYQDLVFIVATRDGRALRIVTEHQRSPERFMSLRASNYVHRLAENSLAERPRARALETALAIVVHQGARPWAGPRRLSALAGHSEAVRGALGSFVPELELIVLDLPGTSDEALCAVRPPLARIVLRLMRAVGLGEDVLRILTDERQALRRWSADPRGRVNVQTVFRYLLGVERGDPARFARRVRQLVGPRTGEMALTMAEQLLEKGRKEGVTRGVKQGLKKGVKKGVKQGLKKGLKQGEKQGLKNGVKRVLRRQLEARFGAIPAHLDARIDRATVAELEAWADRVLTAETLEKVFTRRR